MYSSFCCLKTDVDADELIRKNNVHNHVEDIKEGYH